MDYEKLKQISRIFDRMLTLPPERRTTYIHTLCGDDPEFRQKIEELLALHDQSEELFESHLQKNKELLNDLDSRLPETISLEEDFFTGETLGRWTLTELLGRGGMGSVYKAERTEEAGVRQTGALKIIHKSLLTPLNLERFKIEQQILAGLNHPNIAGFIDCGITPDGIPYMVMEYVEGEPVTDYCNNHRFSTEQRLEVFKTVCRAIQYAHKNLVVHRDLKPENILVTKESRVKILDFGIAKLLDTDLYEFSTVETQPGMRLLSIDYAAPEQVGGEPITTSTDVYALGVLLYQLLTDLRPFDFGKKSYREIEKIIRETEPPRPSQKLIQYPDLERVARIAEARTIQPAELIKKLKGDLDAIAGKALRKNPERRFESTEAFENDIARHLQALPVHARPDSFGYRAKKFTKRHRTAAITTVILSLVLIGFIALYTIRVTTERNRAEQAAIQAQLEAQKAQTVKDFLISIFRTSGPEESRGATVTARELLDEGTGRIRNELSSQPEIQAEMMGVLGEVYQELGLLHEAESLLEQALHLEQSLVLADSSVIADDLTRLAILRYNQGNFEESVRLLRHSMSLYEGLPNPEPASLAEAQNHLGLLLLENGELAPADSLLRLALAARRTLGRPLDLAESLNTRALLLTDQGVYDEAEPLYKEAIELQRNILDSGHPDLIETTYNLAQLYWNQGNLEAAEPLFREVIVSSRKMYGNDHPELALDLSMLGLVLMDQGAFSEAETAYREALAIQQNVFGEEHPDYTATLYNLGSNHFLTERYDSAEQLLRKTLALDTRLFESDHPNLAIDMTRLAAVLRAKGNLTEADSLLDEALSIYRETYPEDHHRIISVKIRMGQIAFNRGQYTEAEPMLRQVLTDTGQSFTNDWKTAEAKSFLGQCLLALGQPTEAEPLLTQALEILMEIFPPDHTMVQVTREALERI